LFFVGKQISPDIFLPLHRSPKLPLTSQRLGEAAASTTFHAGDKRSITH
jgi:hypothetical protein